MKYTVSNIEELEKIIKLLKDNDTILLMPNVYKIKWKVITNNLTIEGIDKDKTIITYDDYSTKTHLDNKEYNTFRTYTMLVMSDNVKIKNITIKNQNVNSFKYSQSVSLHILGTNTIVSNCNISSGQDTLLLGPIPDDLIKRYENFLPKDELQNNKEAIHFFINCLIEGDIDFIFGGGQAYFYQCEIKTISDKTSYVCAPSHNENTKYGFVFNECLFSSVSTKPTVFIARPWRKHAYTLVCNSKYNSHIKKEGFNNWDNEQNNNTVRFYEYNNHTSYKNRVSYSKRMKKDEAFETIRYFEEHLKTLTKD